MSPGSRLSAIRNVMPATNAAMKPEPPSALAVPYASAAPAPGMTWRHAPSIRSRRPAWMTIAAATSPPITPPTTP